MFCSFNDKFTYFYMPMRCNVCFSVGITISLFQYALSWHDKKDMYKHYLEATHTDKVIPQSIQFFYGSNVSIWTFLRGKLVTSLGNYAFFWTILFLAVHRKHA